MRKAAPQNKLKTAKPAYLDKKQIEKLAKEISAFYKKIFHDPLEAILNENNIKYNSVFSELIQAIKDERLILRDGYLIGNINAEILKEMKARGARYVTGKGWLFVNMPPEIQEAIAIKQRETLAKTNSIISYLEQLPAKITEAVEQLPISFISTMSSYQWQINKNFADFTVKPTMTKERAEELQSYYVLELKRYIKDWTPDNIRMLREDIEYYVLQKGYGNKKISELIKQNYNVTQAKAVFLARQESNLLLSNYSESVYKDAGIKRYIWRTAQDGDVRESHRELEGKVFYFDNPPITDPHTGAHNNPGEDYNCRCIPEPIIDE